MTSAIMEPEVGSDQETQEDLPSKSIPPRRRNPKRTGELAEAAFLLKAESLGFKVAKPWGDSERYDFILDSGERLWRVQVKCTSYSNGRGYDVQPIYTDRMRKIPYTSHDIDVLIAYVVPLDIWYVLPVETFAPRKSLRFYPGGAGPGRFEQYCEAWHLLLPKSEIP